MGLAENLHSIAGGTTHLGSAGTSRCLGTTTGVGMVASQWGWTFFSEWNMGGGIFLVVRRGCFCSMFMFFLWKYGPILTWKEKHWVFFEKDKTIQNDLFFSTYIQNSIKDSGAIVVVEAKLWNWKITWKRKEIYVGGRLNHDCGRKSNCNTLQGTNISPKNGILKMIFRTSQGEIC